MVGVAGKSRACYDCRRRRVKCDFGNPSCLRCQKAKLPCRGYGKATVFVNRTMAEPSTSTLTAISEAKDLFPVSTAAAPRPSLQESFQQLRSVTSSSPVEFRHAAYKILKALYLPSNEDGLSQHEGTNAYSWVHATCELQLESRVLDLSLLTFGAIQIHVVEPADNSRDIAMELYSETLPELIRTLADTEALMKDETLAAIVVLSTCELFILPNDGSWLVHAEGISELLRYRMGQSSSNKSEVWLKLCSRMRVICIIMALRKHQRLTLDTATWRRLMHVAPSSERYESLMDLAAAVPTLQENADASSPDVARLQHHLFDIFDGLEQWQRAYPREHNRPLYWAIPSKIHNPSDEMFEDVLFPFMLEFESLDVAIPFLFSTAVMLQCLAAVLRLHSKYIRNKVHSPGGEDEVKRTSLYPPCTSFSPSEVQQRATQLARWICQAFPYCFRSDLGTVCAQSTCHPLWVVGSYFKQTGMTRELAWCRGAKDMDGPGLGRKIELMGFGDGEGWRQ